MKIGKTIPNGAFYTVPEANNRFAKKEDITDISTDVENLTEQVGNLSTDVGAVQDALEEFDTMIPTPESTDEGKVLTANASGGYDLEESVDARIPTPAQADDGKVLTANDTGGYDLETPSSGGLQNLVDTPGVGGVRQIIATETNAANIFAIGERAQCTGLGAIALGQDCHGNAPRCVSIGRYVQPRSSANYAIGIGQYVAPAKEGQTVLGSYNEENVNADFIIGNGNGGLRRHNIIEISNTNNDMKINDNTFTEAMFNYLFSLLTVPTTDGTYKLQCKVTNGIPAFSWVSDV